MLYDSDLAIDLDKVVRSRLSTRKIPQFLLDWGKRFIHQDFINGYLTQGYEGVEFCTNALKYLDVSVDAEGLENLGIMEDHLCTFASNHPLGGVDGIALTGIIGERCAGNIRLMVNDFLMNIKPFAAVSVPINKMGGQSRSLPEQMKALYATDSQLLVFPAGKCSRKIDGKIQDAAWGKSFIKMSVESGRWVVPVRFIGQNSKRFYRVDALAKKLRIKFNLAMMFLPDELYKAQHSRFKVIFGKPIPPSFFDSSKTPYEWAQYVRGLVYKIQNYG